MFEAFSPDPKRVLPNWLSALALRSKLLGEADTEPLEILHDEAFLEKLVNAYQADRENPTKPFVLSAYELAATAKILGETVPEPIIGILEDRAPLQGEWLLSLAVSNLRTWKSWLNKFSDAEKGLWIVVATSHRPDQLDSGWLNLARLYSVHLAKLIAFRTNVSPRIRWRLGEVTVVDVEPRSAT